jgi:NAD(P)-dependent dehydrogenase (short-subunit alcohol dehydrogenase family)
MSLTGKVALIVGGVKNLGADIALQLAPLGSNLALHYHSDASKKDADELKALLTKEFPDIKVAFYQADLTSVAAVEELFSTVVKEFGGVDIVVNTSGMVLKKPIVAVSEAEYDQIFGLAATHSGFIRRFATHQSLESTPRPHFSSQKLVLFT